MDASSADAWIKGLGLAIGAGSAAAAAFTYSRNARVKRAEFLMDLHRDFFVDVDAVYRQMKVVLDCNDASGEAALEMVVQAESPEFTDFLNFFELIAYLIEIQTLERSDAEALLGYYLNLLSEKRSVWTYIGARRNGFECLARLLHERSPM